MSPTRDTSYANHSLRAFEIARHYRRRSFELYVQKSIPILPVDEFAAKRAALWARLSLRPTTPGCILLPTDKKCPRSVGNWQNVLNLALLASHTMHAWLHARTPMTCNSLLTVNMDGHLLGADDASARRTVELGAADVCDWLTSPNALLNADECLILPLLEHGQEIPWCLKIMSDAHNRSTDNTSALFALGPHAAYGAVFDRAFALPNEMLPPSFTEDDEEIRVAVHIRHFDAAHTGAEAIYVFEAEIRKAAVRAKRCAILVASDRRLTLKAMDSVARRVGCRILQIARGEPIQDFVAEHGEDVGAAVLQDIFLLARAHVLIGTWGSTLTVSIQQAIAARSLSKSKLSSFLPTVTYCDLSLRKCLQPLPLLTDPRNHWYLTIRHSGAMRIALEKDMHRVVHQNHGRRDGWMPFPKLIRRSWQPSDSALAALEHAKWPAESPRTSAWLAAIISRDASSDRYRSVAAAVTSCGFEAHLVQAAMPEHFEDLDEMFLELFGSDTRRALRMSPFEIGLLVSHKRALAAIARSSYEWGGVFEDDAVLHPAIIPWRAEYLVRQAFMAASRADGSTPIVGSKTVIYLGACAPQCKDDPMNRETQPIEGIPPELLRVGSCRGYCTHAYAVSRVHAGSFFNDVFNCTNVTAMCGMECRSRPCFLDWAFNRHFTRGHPAWLLGAGLRSPWRDDHRGIFVQNRSAASGNNVTGTSLSKRYSWKLDERKEQAAHERCRALIGAAEGNPVGNASTSSLLRLYVTTRWTGRLGNLLFGVAGLMGIASRLNAIAPTQAFTANPPTRDAVPAAQLFGQFPGLVERVRVYQSEALDVGSRISRQHRVIFEGVADPIQVRQCRPCTWTVQEERANAFEEKKLLRLERWVANPPAGCVLGLVELHGYLQSYKYFDSIADSLIRPAFAPAAATQKAAESVIASARDRAGPHALLVGVQVRLGDKVRGPLASFYASTAWSYYRRGMEYLARHLGTPDANGNSQPIAFIITAGGTMGDNAMDIIEAKRNLASTITGVSSIISFSTTRDPYVDLAILRSCDGLVISSSSLGWWAAYLARLPKGHVVAPRHTINPLLPQHHSLRRGFVPADYIPDGWLLLDNQGNGTVQGETAEEEQARMRNHLARTGFRLEDAAPHKSAFHRSGVSSVATTNMFENPVLRSAFEQARKARARRTAARARVGRRAA